MLNTLTCHHQRDRLTASELGSCALCAAATNLESWMGFLEDFQIKNPNANFDDVVLMERLNLLWLFEVKPSMRNTSKKNRRAA